MTVFPKQTKTIAALLSAGFLFATGALAQSQDLSEDQLSEIYQDCVLGCVGSMEGDMCEQLCNCAAREMSERFDSETYEGLKSEIEAGEVSEANEGLMGEVGSMCAAELGITPDDGQQ